MKRLFALLALVGAVGFGAPAWAEEKAAVSAAPVAAARHCLGMEQQGPARRGGGVRGLCIGLR